MTLWDFWPRLVCQPNCCCRSSVGENCSGMKSSPMTSLSNGLNGSRIFNKWMSLKWNAVLNPETLESQFQHSCQEQEDQDTDTGCLRGKICLLINKQTLTAERSTAGKARISQQRNEQGCETPKRSNLWARVSAAVKMTKYKVSPTQEENTKGYERLTKTNTRTPNEA